MESIRFLVIFFNLVLQFGISRGAIQINITPEEFVSTLEDEVHISCLLDSFHDTGSEISAIELYKDAARPIVLLRDCSNISYENGASTNIQAEGLISGNVVKSYLNVTMSFPNSKDTGVYTCVVFYFDEDGVMKEDRATGSLLVEQPTVDVLELAIGNIKKSMVKLKEDANYKSAFSVTADASFYLNMDDVLVLPTVLTKVGDDYDEDTGIFSPKRAGLYAFHLNIRVESSAYVELKVNDVIIKKLSCSHTGSWDASSMSLVHELWPGDKVKVVHVSNRLLYHSGRQVTFSGNLITLL